MESLTIEPRDFYEGVATAWASGPAAMYDRLAIGCDLGASLTSFRGAIVLDVGAGTGALCRALRASGAIPIAVDMSQGHARPSR